MKVNGLVAIFIRVSNLEQSFNFYSEVLNLQLRDIEEWDDGRGANYIIAPGSPLLTLIECSNPQNLDQPLFNLSCENIQEWYDDLKEKEVKVSSINRWSSQWNDHIDFDVYDPDGNPINIIEIKNK